MRCHCPPDARGDADLRTLDRDGALSDRLPSSFCDSLQFIRCAIGKYNQELFSSVTTDEIVGADGEANSASGLLKNGVPAKMSVSIIDLFEVIEVNQENASGHPRPCSPLQFAFQ